jgi:glycosyltransferase involved in cell wall biosynthesis
MTDEMPPTADRLRLAWVSPVTPDKLDSATWVDTTRELRRQGVDVTLITIGPAGRQSYRGVEVLSIPRPSVYLFGQILFHLNVLRYLLPRLRAYDVILFHQLSAIWLLPLRVFGRRRPRLVMDTRDMVDFANGSLKVRLRTVWFDLIIRLAARLADGQTAITPRMAELVRIPREQLWGIWPSGVEADRFAAAAKARHWPYRGEAIRLVYVGVFLAKRHLLPLCRAVNRANAEGMAFVLSLYGDGPQRPELESVAAEGGGAVRVEHPVPHDNVPHVLARAHVGVTSLPEVNDVKYEASSPIKLFEYMAAGMPVLATSNKCHTDVVGQGRYAFWADDVSEETLLAVLRRVWAGYDELRQLGREAQIDVHDWTYAANAAKLKAALIYGLGRDAYTRATVGRVRVESR